MNWYSHYYKIKLYPDISQVSQSVIHVFQIASLWLAIMRNSEVQVLVALVIYIWGIFDLYIRGPFTALCQGSHWPKSHYCRNKGRGTPVALKASATYNYTWSPWALMFGLTTAVIGAMSHMTYESITRMLHTWGKCREWSPNDIEHC